MRRLIRKIIPLLAIALIISCSDDSTGPDTEPDPDSDSDPEPTTGTVEITTATSGEDQDEDGYTVTLGDNEEDISASETITFEELDEGNYDAELSGVADNCNVDGDNPRSIEVTAGETASETFEVSCEMMGTPKIVAMQYLESTSPYVDNQHDIVMMNPDGSEIENLTNTSETSEYDPAISHDGSKIAYRSPNSDFSENILYVMDIESGDTEEIASSEEDIFGISWSPDDTKIAFDDNQNGNSDIYVINSDGTDRQRVTEDPAKDGSPEWSPDGEKIIFDSDRNGLIDLYTINIDGSELQQITKNGEGGIDPSWSSVTNKIAFMGGFGGDIYTVDPDGNNLEQITDGGVSPSWSPNSMEIVFSDGDISIVDTEDGSIEEITSDEYNESDPDWGLIND